MFTKEDYAVYFDELADISKKILVIYTDLLNEITDQSIKSKLYAVTSESMDCFRLIREVREKIA